MTDWAQYERRKAIWIANHPDATPQEYQRAAIKEFTTSMGNGVATPGKRRHSLAAPTHFPNGIGVGPNGKI